MSSADDLHTAHLDTLGLVADRARKGCPPTVREVALHFQLATSGAQHRLGRLRELGLLTWEAGTPRTIRPTEKGWQTLGRPAREEDEERERILRFLSGLEGQLEQRGDEAGAVALATAHEAIAQNQHRRSA